MRYLVRLANNQGYAPKDVNVLQAKIRELFGSAEKIGNLRISTIAIEFDLFTEPTDLNGARSLLETKISKVVTVRAIDTRVSTRAEDEMLRAGIELFNQERFWEAHEVLEEIWHPAKGVERDVIQGLILTAAALVHYQKNEKTVCISILGRARDKLGSLDNFKGLDIGRLRASMMQILEANIPTLVKIEWVKTESAPEHP